MTQQRANEIKDNIKHIQDDMAEIAAKYNLPQKTTLMAVTKTFPAEDVAVALESGLTLFGENRIQEAYSKFQNDVFKDKTFDLHIIGHLQRNKAAHAVEVMSM
ncbi:MAG: YggS family pyridoxal phosphate-dependent enzyme, partial [Spirochaetales bacterium]|nr:YggS family pyridoxal phosphate-dependent enzyme [Spirochaetales bacterium]